jgi:hypothetical protein
VNNGTINSGPFKYNDKLYIYDDKASKTEISVASESKETIYWMEFTENLETLSYFSASDIQKISAEKTAKSNTILLIGIVVPKESRIEAIVTTDAEDIEWNDVKNTKNVDANDKIIIMEILMQADF